MLGMVNELEINTLYVYVCVRASVFHQVKFEKLLFVYDFPFEQLCLGN